MYKRQWYADIPGAATDIAGLILDYGVEGLKSIMPGPELTGYNLEKDLKIDQLQRGLREPALGYKHLERVGEKVGYIPPTTGTDAEFMARLAAGIVDPIMVGGAAGTTARQITKASKAADAKPIFTSPGQKAAADIAKETIPANKVRSQLEGRGVNKDELEWTGFNEWIKTKKGEVSKAEIEEFFQQNQIEVREVLRSDKTSDAEFRTLARERTADELELVMSNNEGLYNMRDEIQPLIERYREGDGAVREQLDEWFEGYGYDDQNYIDTFYEGVYGTLRSTDIPGNVKFGSPSWQLPGGENYRELVLMVPPKKVPWTKENVVPISADEAEGGMHIESFFPSDKDKVDKFWWFKTPEGKAKRPKILRGTEAYPGDTTISQESALQNVLNTQPEPKPRYTGGHFEENDVVAHIRFNERVDPDGNKVLFIEEIQSDWAHKGEAEGFYTAGSRAAEKRMGEIGKRQNQISNEISEITREPSYTREGGDPLLRIAELEKENRVLQQEYEVVSKKDYGYVPEGPFVTDTHQWTNLALKRMIRWGSDNGFDSIAWVTGKQSAERYKVSKQISKIEYNSNGVLNAYDKDGSKVITEFDVTPEKLVDYIGKEPANKLLKQEAIHATQAGAEHITYQTLKGLDLDIGGEYHKLIYDQVLTAQAKKIGKKHGAKVEESGVIATDPEKLRKAYKERYADDYEIANINDYPEVFEDEIASRIPGARSTVIVDSNGEYLRDIGGDIIFFDDVAHAKDQINYSASRAAEEMPEKELMEMYEDIGEAAEKVWSMRLTDKLKQASKDGMPYYVALPPLVMGAAAQRSDAQRQQSKSDAQAILAN